jgi:hypothetical protein
MTIQAASLQLAKTRWNKHTRFVVTDEVLKYIKTNGLFWAHDPTNRTPICMTRNGDNTFMPLFWFYDDGNVTFASVQKISIDKPDNLV